MYRIPVVGALLLLTSALAYGAPPQAAQTQATVPPPFPVTPASGGNSGNPFAPRQTNSAPVSSVPDFNLPPPPAAPTEASVRESVEKAYRDGGYRVGRVNGQTFFKLGNSYLFVPTGLEDAQPVVAKPTQQAPVMKTGVSGSALSSHGTGAPTMNPGASNRPVLNVPPAALKK